MHTYQLTDTCAVLKFYKSWKTPCKLRIVPLIEMNCFIFIFTYFML